MIIDDKTRKKLISLFEGVDYRKIVAERADCHPNTVTNVLMKGTGNIKVANELVKLGRELKVEKQNANKLEKQTRFIASQL